MKNKYNCMFIKFDVESFYPSISYNLFQKAIALAKQYAKFTDVDIKDFMQARKTFSFL